MREHRRPPAVVSRVGFADMYWTPAQQLAHATVNGATVRPGDLFASGTVSGATPGSEGCLIEATGAGGTPIELPGGETRSYLQDGDTVVLRGWAGGDGTPRIGLGEVTGTVAPAVEEV
jgi:fumarylacetoacetase